MRQPARIESGASNQAGIDVIAFAADPDTVASIEDATAQYMVSSHHIARGTVRDATAFIEKQVRPPRLLIVDVSGTELPLSEIDALAEACEPSVSVIVLGERQDVGLFRELIRLGVTDYLVKPVLPDLLGPYLSGAQQQVRSQPHRTGKVVAIAGARGGVGTSSVAAGIASILANKQNRRVVLIDLNLHGGSIGVQMDAVGGGLGEALDNASHLDALFLERTLIAKGPRLFVLGDELSLDLDAKIDDKALEALLQALERQFHYVVIDLPHTAGAAFAYTLRRAGLRVLITDRTVPGMRELARMLNVMDGTSGRSMVVLNDSRPHSEGLIERSTLEETLGRPFELVLPYDKTLAKVMDNLGDPVTEASGSFVSELNDLANLLAGQRPRKAKGWLRLISKR